MIVTFALLGLWAGRLGAYDPLWTTAFGAALGWVLGAAFAPRRARS